MTPHHAAPPTLAYRALSPVLHAMAATDLQALYFESISQGPNTLLQPIRDEFAVRGLNPFGPMEDRNQLALPL